jgi:hypothetical protein
LAFGATGGCGSVETMPTALAYTSPAALVDAEEHDAHPGRKRRRELREGFGGHAESPPFRRAARTVVKGCIGRLERQIPKRESYERGHPFITCPIESS